MLPADTRDLCIVQDVKDAFEPAISSSTRDDRIQQAITDASVTIMGFLERELTPRTPAATRLFMVEDGGEPGTVVDLNPYDLRAATLVRLHPESTQPITLTANQDYALEPLGSPQGSFTKVRLSAYLFLGSSFSRMFGYAQLEVTGSWGLWDTAQVPPDVRAATVLTVRSWIRQNPAAYAFHETQEQQGPMPEAPQTFAIPGGAIKKLSRYRRWSL